MIRLHGFALYNWIMKRTTANLAIDLLAAAFFLGMLATGYILYFTLPPGSNRTLALWHGSRHQWGQVHFWLSTGFIAILLVHLALHWKWIVVVLAQRFGLERKVEGGWILGSGVLAFLVVASLVGLFAWWTEMSVQEREPLHRLVGEPLDGKDGLTAKEAIQPTAGVADKIDFWKEVYPIIEKACLRCHGPRRGYGDFRADRKEDYFGAPGKQAFVIPGQSHQSELIAIVTGQRPDMAMARSHLLPDREVAVLRAWIDAGAPWPEKEPVK